MQGFQPKESSQQRALEITRSAKAAGANVPGKAGGARKAEWKMNRLLAEQENCLGPTRKPAEKIHWVCQFMILKIKARGDGASHKRISRTFCRPGAKPVAGRNYMLQPLSCRHILTQNTLPICPSGDTGKSSKGPPR